MNLSLVVINAGKAAGQIVPVPVAEFLVGRDAQCNLRPASILISKRHCAIVTRGDEAFVRDFGSTNGTSVNDQPVKGEVAIRNDDILKIGPLTFRVAIAQQAGTPPRPVDKVAPPTPAAKETFASGQTRVEHKVVQHDDHAADLLLEMDIGDITASDSPNVPDGSTIQDVLPSLLDTKPEKGQTPPNGFYRPAKKETSGNAQTAAQALFAKLKNNNNNKK